MGYAGKRAIDVLFAVTLLILCAPLFGVTALLLRLDGGAAFYSHRRIGYDGKSFGCLKFRSMVPDADAVLARHLAEHPTARLEWERDQKLRADPRVTPVGWWLRKTSLDELPQLVNVVRGEMSLVGPRPIVTAEISRYGDAFADYCACRPGITGLWQVSGRNDVGYAERVALDREYSRSSSLKVDLAVLLRTLVVVTRGRGAY